MHRYCYPHTDSPTRMTRWKQHRSQYTAVRLKPIPASPFNIMSNTRVLHLNEIPLLYTHEERIDFFQPRLNIVASLSCNNFAIYCRKKYEFVNFMLLIDNTLDNGAHTFLVHVHEIQIRENSKLIAILCGFRARLNFPLIYYRKNFITERAPVASNKKSYVPRKNSIVIKVLQQLFLDGSWRGGVREIIFFRRIGEGVFFLYYFKSFNFFQVVGVQSSHTICPN